MGSWNVYCNASKLCIADGTDAVVLPIRPKESPTDFSKWVPATLPIFGTYDDYGRLANIEENSHTKLVEKHFGKNIYEFQEALERGNLGFEEGVNNTQFMWFRRDVYDYLSKENLNSNFYSDKIKGVNFGEHFILKSLGFVKQEEESGEERYTQKWVHPDGHILHSDGTWCHHSKSRRGLYCWGDFKKEGITVPKELSEKKFVDFWWELEKLTTPEDKLIAELMKGVPGTREKTEVIMGWDWRTIYDKVTYKSKTKGILVDYMKLVNEELDMAILSSELTEFIQNCFGTYTLIRPTINHSPQFGEWGMSQKFANKVSELANEDVKHYCEED